MTITIGWWIIPVILTILALRVANAERDDYGIVGMLMLIPILAVWLIYLAARLWGLPV